MLFFLPILRLFRYSFSIVFFLKQLNPPTTQPFGQSDRVDNGVYFQINMQ